MIREGVRIDSMIGIRVGVSQVQETVRYIEQQLDIIQYVKPTAYVGVPDYLKILLDKAKEAGKDASSFKKALVGGAALLPS